jgi:mannosyltransferase OCH1-like enzyme
MKKKFENTENPKIRFSPLEFSYKTYWYSVKRPGLARLIILHPQPGIYADLDIYPCETNAGELILNDASFIIGRSSEDNCSINHFLIREKHSDMINSILHEFHQKIDFQTNFYSSLFRGFLKQYYSKKELFHKVSRRETTNTIKKSIIKIYLS